MHFKAAVFDFNGTLVWDSPHHNRAFDIFLEKHGIALTDEEKTTRIYGKTNPDIMRGIFERPLTDEEIEDFSIEKELIYQQMIVDELHFAEGAEELFAFLKANSVPFTIATSADNFNLDFYFFKTRNRRETNNLEIFLILFQFFTAFGYLSLKTLKRYLKTYRLLF